MKIFLTFKLCLVLSINNKDNVDIKPRSLLKLSMTNVNDRQSISIDNRLDQSNQ